MKLIDADALRQDVLALPNCYNGFSDAYDKALIIGLIDEQIVVDAVPVVRCGECKYLAPGGICETFADDMIEPSASDYCSYGERRTDVD